MKVGRYGDFQNRAEGAPFPCGQCLPCRINRRRVWTLRLMLESYYHEKACFVTLTYDADHVPMSPHGLPVLDKREIQLWLKRVRKLFCDRSLRFYLCGEYGGRSFRPHYHAILFGVDASELDPEWLIWKGQSGPATNTRPARLNTPLYRSWHRGIVHVGECNRKSIQYVAGYVLKKIVKVDRRSGMVLPNIIDGAVEEFSEERTPEFGLMSRRPGLGFRAVEDIKKSLLHFSSVDDFRRELRVDGKLWPLGRFLLDKLQICLEREFDSSSYLSTLTTTLVESEKTGRDFLELLVERDSGKVALLESKQKLFPRCTL